jgi:hypothetical protein
MKIYKFRGKLILFEYESRILELDTFTMFSRRFKVHDLEYFSGTFNLKLTDNFRLIKGTSGLKLINLETNVLLSLIRRKQVGVSSCRECSNKYLLSLLETHRLLDTKEIVFKNGDPDID